MDKGRKTLNRRLSSEQPNKVSGEFYILMRTRGFDENRSLITKEGKGKQFVLYV